MRNALFTLLLFFFLPFIFAQSIELNYPNEVQSEEAFEVALKLDNFSEGTYDVKIDVFVDGKHLAQTKILSGEEWKRSDWYVNGAISAGETKTFSLRVTNYSGDAELIVRIRNIELSSEVYPLLIKENTNSEKNPEETAPSPEKKESEPVATTKTSSNEEDTIDQPRSEELNTSLQERSEPITDTPIILTNSVTKDIKTTPAKEFISSTTLAWIGLFWFSVLIAFLLMLQKRKYTNEFE